jgi:hypothetical protein
MERAGIVLEFGSEEKSSSLTENISASDSVTPSSVSSAEYEDFTTQELNEMLKEAIGNEDYEKASLIRDELNKRTES